MPTDISKQSSFSRGRRWAIGVNLLTRTALVLAVAVMINYLGAQFSHRFYLSKQTRVQLSPRTLSVLHSMTNSIAVTLYYDRKDDYYPEVTTLLDEYTKANPKITVRTVDYLRDYDEAEKVKEKYKLDTAGDKNLIIFDAGEGRVKIGNGDDLIQYASNNKLTKDRRLEFVPVAFRGEMLFTAMLLTLENPRPFNAYFLKGDGEALADSRDRLGYLKFAITLAQNFIAVTNLDLSGANEVPANCDLLVIAGPTAMFREPELRQIDQFLAQGGRLLVLFNYASVNTGLEPILQRWGVNVGAGGIKDPDNSTGSDVLVVNRYGQHPVVNALAGNNLALNVVLPRPVSAVHWNNPPPDPPQVTELAFSGNASRLSSDPAAPPRSYPLGVAVEEKNAAGVAAPRGTTRIVVFGDSLLWANTPIDYGGNREFATAAVNWLLDRGTLLEGVGPRRVTEFRLSLTKSQSLEIRWVLLGALPGGVLLLGGLVWLVRRK
jgi:hypothetical protein